MKRSDWELRACPFCGSGDLTRRHTGDVDDQQCKACWSYWSEADLTHLNDRFVCPRRLEDRQVARHDLPDFWHQRDGRSTCGYCGSLPGPLFMELCRDGTIVVGPTDKNYKAYVSTVSGEHEGKFGKFYFQHLAPEDRHEFIELLNAGLIKIDTPGYFYTLPFFMKYGEP